MERVSLNQSTGLVLICTFLRQPLKPFSVTAAACFDVTEM